MISRTFTVDDGEGTDLACYKGFNANRKPSDMDLVGIIKVEGSFELYVLDDTKEARMEFVRYVSEQFGEYAQIVGIYRRSK